MKGGNISRRSATINALSFLTAILYFDNQVSFISELPHQGPFYALIALLCLLIYQWSINETIRVSLEKSLLITTIIKGFIYGFLILPIINTLRFILNINQDNNDINYIFSLDILHASYMLGLISLFVFLYMTVIIRLTSMKNNQKTIKKRNIFIKR